MHLAVVRRLGQHLELTSVSKIRFVFLKRAITHRSGIAHHYTPAYYQQPGKEPLIYRNLGQQLLRAAELYGDRPAIIACTEHKELTFAAASEEAAQLALQLRELGLRRGDHLGIWAPNTVQWYITFLAAALLGLPLVCINPAIQSAELAYALRKARVNALVTMDVCGKQQFVQVLGQLLPEKLSKCPELKVLLIKSTAETPRSFSAHNYEALMQQPTRSHDVALLKLQVPQIGAEQPCNIQFTSGTTGQPKAALLSHFNYVNQAHLFGVTLGLQQPAPQRICCTVPFFHAFGLSTMVAALDYGATLVLPSYNFNAAAALQCIESERCHVILGTPTMFVDMLQQQESLRCDLQSLQLGVVGGAPCAPHINQRVRRELGLCRLRIGYGLSEGTAAMFSQDDGETEEQAMLSVGRLFDHVEAKVVNEQGETVNFGERGELCVRGFLTMRGYYEDEQKTREIRDELGWLHTGDEFILEANGIGRIVGRKKDMIIRGGENIFPKEIEDCLQLHKDILEAQVIGVPDERMGEELCAYIRQRPGTETLTTQQLKQFCEGRLSHFKVPRYVRLIAEFPKTTSGKIQKFRLRELFAAEMRD